MKKMYTSSCVHFVCILIINTSTLVNTFSFQCLSTKMFRIRGCGLLRLSSSRNSYFICYLCIDSVSIIFSKAMKKHFVLWPLWKCNCSYLNTPTTILIGTLFYHFYQNYSILFELYWCGAFLSEWFCRIYRM